MLLPEQTLLELIRVGDERVVRSTEWYSELKRAINELISKDFTRLVQVLYSADVSESKLKKQLEDYPGTDASAIIADLLLERQIQKIKAKRSLQPDAPASDEERW